ncbi:MAG TPA: SDR family oxidoreductase [Gammaproteobacteria bacterium]|nr:SDR family oxidoreductase [Gammaproteobacteria bacterium]
MSAARPVALVTGASAGLGTAFARAYAARGHDLVLTARRVERLEALAAELGARHAVKSHVIPADLSVPGAAAALFDAVEARDLRIDVLINNAGYGVPGGYLGQAWPVHAAFQQVMIESVAELCWRVAPGMRARGGGRIVNVASLAGLVPGGAGHTLYGPAKAWMIHFSECLHAELAPAGIVVCALCPGFTYTEFHDVNGMRPQVSRLPRALWMTAEEVVREGLAAVDRGKAVHVVGRLNRLIAAAARYLPRRLVRAAVATRERDFRRID